MIAPSAVRRVLDACHDTVVRAMYGASELTLFVTSVPMVAPYREGATVPVGRPMDNIRAYILDEHLHPVPSGTCGELYVGGTRLAQGYHNRPGLTAARFVADPFGPPGERMYRTGDLARWTSDGLIDFVGRVDDQVKIRGFLVARAEVESALARHPAVAHVAVVAQELEPGSQRLVAYVVPHDRPDEVADLSGYATSVLPDYMVPSAFVTLDALPLTPNGKLDRAALPAPELDRVSPYRAPRNLRQQALCRVFAEVLGVDRVGIVDSFFDLDGQSLLAIRLISRIQTELGADLAIGDLFNAPTVAELDDLIESRAMPEGGVPTRIGAAEHT